MTKNYRWKTGDGLNQITNSRYIRPTTQLCCGAVMTTSSLKVRRYFLLKNTRQDFWHLQSNTLQQRPVLSCTCPTYAFCERVLLSCHSRRIVSWVVRRSCWALPFPSHVCATAPFKVDCQASAMCFTERSSQCWHFHHPCTCQPRQRAGKNCTWQAAGSPSQPWVRLKPHLHLAGVLQWDWFVSHFILSERPRFLWTAAAFMHLKSSIS